MSSKQAFPAFCGACYTFCFGMLLFCVVDAKYTGTTIGFKKIFLGRCYEYVDKYLHLGFVDKPPAPGKEEEFCLNIRKLFLQAFASKDACKVTAEDYKPFFEATGKSLITDKILFWSKHEKLSRQISNNGERAVVLADTLAGYLTTDLTWCGEVKGSYNPPNPDGINFHECPVCRKDPVKDKNKKEWFEVYWGIASELFAKRAKGVIHHLVNGAVGKTPPNVAYHEKTFFYMHELPNIDKTKVTQFRLIVANEPGLTVHETCGTGTIKKLQDEIKKTLGKDAICIVNPSLVMHLMCANKPNAPDCVKAIPYTEY